MGIIESKVVRKPVKPVKTVSQVNSYIKSMFDRDINLINIDVSGEISNCKYHSSGHIYFSLKDDYSVISCVMFASAAATGLKFKMNNGDKVIVHGKITVYERDGKFQIYASSIKKEGRGDIFEEFERRKKKLEAEGLFDPAGKKPLPQYAMKIGVVTSRTGAVIQDIINVSTRRNPHISIILYPASVQGEGSDITIVKGIEYFNHTDVDVIIIGRGGGSIEDLWEFNSEVLAYAIADSEKPVISAVGHETDFTIADFVADRRAATPSAAAELAVFEYEDFYNMMMDVKFSLSEIMDYKVKKITERLQNTKNYMMLLSPKKKIEDNEKKLKELREKLVQAMHDKLENTNRVLENQKEQLKILLPTKKLTGGFGYITDESGKGVTDISLLETGNMLHILTDKGRVKVEVKEVELDEK